jgi:hypothetical protein
MSDIFVESEDLKNIKSFITELHNRYINFYNEHKKEHPYDGVDEIRRKSALGLLHWPGDELVTQIIIDASKLMVEHNIDPKVFARG